jgi:hypothetical protein
MGRRKSKVCAPRKRNTTEAFRTEVDFEQVLYRLALHAQSLFTAVACLVRAQVVLPGGDSAADLASARLLKLLDPLDTSVTWSPTKGPPPFSQAIVLTQRGYISRLTSMEVHFRPETESRLNELASRSGLPTDDLMEDAMAGYLQEVTEVRQMLDSRYDDIKCGRVKPVEGEVFFESLRQREDELLKNLRNEYRAGFYSSPWRSTGHHRHLGIYR